MGYESDFAISTTPALFTKVDTDRMEKELGEVSGGYGFEFYSGEFHLGAAKWYDCAKDMVTLSRKWPGLVFTVERIGEEAGEGEKYELKNGERLREWKRGWELVE